MNHKVELYSPLPPGSEPTKIRSLRTGELTYISNGNGQLLRAHPKIKGKSNVKKYKRLRHNHD